MTKKKNMKMTSDSFTFIFNHLFFMVIEDYIKKFAVLFKFVSGNLNSIII